VADLPLTYTAELKYKWSETTSPPVRLHSAYKDNFTVFSQTSTAVALGFAGCMVRTEHWPSRSLVKGCPVSCIPLRQLTFCNRSDQDIFCITLLETFHANLITAVHLLTTLIHALLFVFLALQPIVVVFSTAQLRALASSGSRLLDHTQRRATVGRTPLDK
jgi:hypothetical protein